MSQRKRVGWFSKAVKVLASVTALLAWTGNLVTNVEGGDADYLLQQNVDYDGVSWSVLEDTEISGDTETYPLQKHQAESSCDAFYMLVSTIDGKVSALDLQDKGSLVWSIQADARPLYSSSLANMEMIRNGKKMRLIPSLDGALYQFDGDKVEAIPLSAETLLSSTYRLVDDSMIVGSKDLRNFGVSILTGEVKFTCGSEGCSNYEGKMKDEALDGRNLIVLTRSTQVVRSVDIKNGIEKWNFSVGQHQVSLPSMASPSEFDESDSIPVFTSFSDECVGEDSNSNTINYENLQLLVPEGRVVALNKGDFSSVFWEYKFDSPIAKAWLLRHGKLESLSLFNGRNIPTLRAYSAEFMDNNSMLQPLLYIGSHQKHLYIQPSPQLEAVLKQYTNHRIGHFIEPKVQVSWRPYPNTASTSSSVFGGKRPQIAHDQHHVNTDKEESTSLTVWHEDYPFDTGYFLYPEIQDTRTTEAGSTMFLEQDKEEREEQKETWLPVSLWLYWKEVTFISIAVSATIHIILSRVFSDDRRQCSVSLEADARDNSKNSNSSHGMIASDSMTLFVDRMSISEEYVSRFATDFDCLHCLGKGGFGVVFEAVNRVDDQHYAVKRTQLPKSKGAKEKVLREVRALAKLEHIGIVRYFNAWVESPPVGWQEERDKQFHLSDMSGPTSYSDTVSRPAQHKPILKHDVPDAGRQGTMGNNFVDSLDKILPGCRAEAFLDTDSVIFSSEARSQDCHLTQTGSGEFSVHHDLSKVSDNSESDFLNSSKGLFTFGAMIKSKNFTRDDISESRSSIPFSNYTSNSSANMSHMADHSHLELSGDSVVFESPGKDPPCSISFGVSRSSLDDSIVFKNSSFTNDNSNCHKSLILSRQEHHTVDILSSQENRNKDEDDEPEETETHLNLRFFLYIQMQLYSKETLKDWLSNNTLNRDRHTVLDIFDQIVCAVDYVHSQELMHRDLKPSNIFFTADGIVKVGDFGLVTALNVHQDSESETVNKSNGKHTAEVGTTLYMSPEQIAKKPYDLKIDIFSLGLIFLELWIPFSTEMERIRTLLEARRHIFPSRFKRELPSESELVHKMTSSDPVLRPVTKEILDHPLFTEFAPTRIGKRQHKRTISGTS